MSQNRLDRELETRTKTTRKKAWTRPTVLPDPTPEDGYTYHWVRISTNGQSDATNISSKIREGWEPVRAQDHPEIFTDTVSDERFKDNVIAQANAAMDQSDIGANVYFAAVQSTSTGDTATGNSTSAVVGATQTAAAAFRVVAAVSALTESNPDILVKFNPGGHQMTNNVGI
jgi:hypothetical protein